MKKKKTLGAMYKSLLVDKSIKGIFDAMGPPTMGPGGSKNQVINYLQLQFWGCGFNQ